MRSAREQEITAQLVLALRLLCDIARGSYTLETKAELVQAVFARMIDAEKLEIVARTGFLEFLDRAPYLDGDDHQHALAAESISLEVCRTLISEGSNWAGLLERPHEHAYRSILSLVDAARAAVSRNERATGKAIAP